MIAAEASYYQKLAQEHNSSFRFSIFSSYLSAFSFDSFLLNLILHKKGSYSIYIISFSVKLKDFLTILNSYYKWEKEPPKKLYNVCTACANHVITMSNVFVILKTILRVDRYLLMTYSKTHTTTFSDFHPPNSFLTFLKRRLY